MDATSRPAPPDPRRVARAAGITSVGDEDVEHLNRAWHRLDPWPDTVAGLTRLKERFVIATLSNGNMSLLTNMAKRAGLPWDCVISAELFRHYKPDPQAYLGCADLLGVRPDQLMLVAAHPSDLRARARGGPADRVLERPHDVRGLAGRPRARRADHWGGRRRASAPRGARRAGRRTRDTPPDRACSGRTARRRSRSPTAALRVRRCS